MSCCQGPLRCCRHCLLPPQLPPQPRPLLQPQPWLLCLHLHRRPHWVKSPVTLLLGREPGRLPRPRQLQWQVARLPMHHEYQHLVRSLPPMQLPTQFPPVHAYPSAQRILRPSASSPHPERPPHLRIGWKTSFSGPLAWRPPRPNRPTGRPDAETQLMQPAAQVAETTGPAPTPTCYRRSPCSGTPCPKRGGRGSGSCARWRPHIWETKRSSPVCRSRRRASES